MKLTESEIKKVHISEIEGCDPVTLLIEDFGPGKGRITIQCWDKAWTSSWGACGEKGVLSFFLSCDKYYLLKNFVPHERCSEPDVEEQIKEMKREFLRARTETDISKETAKEFWDDKIKGSNGLESIERITDIEYWVHEINYDLDLNGLHLYEEWYMDIPTKLTSEGWWMRERIIPAIKKAFEKSPEPAVVEEAK
jgi:hypothetical protein